MSNLPGPGENNYDTVEWNLEQIGRGYKFDIWDLTECSESFHIPEQWQDCTVRGQSFACSHLIEDMMYSLKKEAFLHRLSLKSSRCLRMASK